MIKKIDNVLEELKLYSLVDQRSDITKKQETLKYALDMAKDNLKSARSLGDSSYIIECDSMLSEVTIEYSKYNEELNKITSDLRIEHAEKKTEVSSLNYQIDALDKQLADKKQMYDELESSQI